MSGFLLRHLVPCWLVVLIIGIGPDAWGQSPGREGPPLSAWTDSGRAARLPLRSETIRVQVDAQMAQTTLQQVYKNESGARLEGRFALRAGEGATISGFAYWNGQNKIVGEVFEKSDAHEIYDRTVNRRKDPGLLEQVGEGTFTFKVFPIEPRERKRVEVQWDRWLKRRGSAVELRVPVASRRADIAVVISDPRGLASITSPTHAIETRPLGNGRVQVRVSRARGTPKHFVLRYRVGVKPLKLSAFVHRDRGHDGYAVVTVAGPAQARGRMPKDVTLVIDRSGSMAGDALHNARQAAANIVARLGGGDRVNVILFDEQTDPLFDRPHKASAKVKREAIEFIQAAQDGGGTDIAAALHVAFARQHDGRRPKTMIFMTDGQSDSEAALETADEEQRDVRVFTLGLGDGVERPLLSRLAASKRGRFVFVADAGELETKVATLYKQIEAPIVVDLELDTDGDARLTQVFPAALPDVFAGDEIQIVGRVEGTGAMRVRLRGTDVQGRVQMATTVQVPRRTSHPWVGRMWAQARVHHLLEEMALGGEDVQRVGETVELALAYNLVTPYTAFLAIPESELTWDTAQILRNARKAKKHVLARNPDARAVSAGSTGGAAHSSDEFADEALMSDRSSDRAPRTMSKTARRKSGSAAGCASCRVGAHPAPAILVFGLLVVGLRRRRRA